MPAPRNFQSGLAKGIAMRFTARYFIALLISSALAMSVFISRANADRFWSDLYLRQRILIGGAFNTGYTSKSLVSNGAAYSREQLIWDFVNITFSNALWLENTVNPWDSISALRDKLNSPPSRIATWVPKYTRGPDPLPPTGVLHKWTQDITIGVGWPLPAPSNNGLDIDKYAPIIEQHLTTLLPELSELTGLQIRYVSPENERAQGKSIALLRIVPEAHMGLNNQYKGAINSPPDTTWENATIQFLQSLVGAVPFTPGMRAQVDGFLIPSFDNSISGAVCRISTLVDKEMFKSLISECVIRALGLPEISKLTSEAFLGHWNASEDAGALVPAKEGRKAFTIAENAQRPDGVAQPSLRMVTDFDKTQIKLLYCKALKPGMDRANAVLSIYTDPNCLSNILPGGESK
jgi:hypothetical protein